jgi:oligopeptide/dipeptide ABC transporter ATP-binding protein
LSHTKKTDEDILLHIEDLSVHFFTFRGEVKALDGVSFDLIRGETMGLVGETGCGKSVTSLSILRLLPESGRILGGKIIFNGENLLDKTEEEMRNIRGHKIAMIFQDPTTSLNPVFTVGDQVTEALTLHQSLKGHKVWMKAVDALKVVSIPLAESRAKDYPHEFSGGMKQRVVIAMGVSCNPELLIADEPTTALDVTIQAQILELFKDLRRKIATSTLLITHDLGIVAEMCHRVAVMYAGNIFELAGVKTIFKSPQHPYTRGLINAVPSILAVKERLEEIPGFVPSLIEPPSGCRFHPRCIYAQKSCKEEKPPMVEIEPGHMVACHVMPFKED